MTLGQLAADEKAESGAGHIAERGIAGSLESLEDPLAFAFRNSRAVVRE